MRIQGEPIRGELHSADASAGVEVPLFSMGSLTQRTLASDEYIEIHEGSLVTVPGGDSYLFIGADATAGAGEYAIRGTFAANGGHEKRLARPFAGGAGQKAYAVAPAGVVDVLFTGTIRKQGSSTRPSWKESLF